MSWKVRTKERLGKYRNMKEEDVARGVFDLRYTDRMSWQAIGRLVGLNGKSITRLLERHGYELQEGPLPDPSKAARNERIIEIANDNYRAGIHISGTGIADLMKLEGWDVNRDIVEGVIFRARKNGRQVPPVGEASNAYKARACNAHNRPPGAMETYPLPPRTPELLAKAKVSYEALKPSMCQYTPNEEAPFFFCGEAAMPRKSWCKDCYERIIRRDLSLEPPGRGVTGSIRRGASSKLKAPTPSSRYPAH